MERIALLDTTLRDGTQAEGVSLSVSDKLHIAAKLDELGITYIEGGFPAANPKDNEFFTRARTELNLKNARLTAFGSTRRPSSSADQDEGLKALLASEAPALTIVGKSWDLHVREALQVSLEQNLEMIRDSVQWLKQHGREVIFDAEHFFDGFRENPEYALQVLRTAEAAGADWVTLCDTNGGSLPDHIRTAVRAVSDTLRIPVGIHAHNDCELAVANTLAAIEAGATMVHGTMNGIGERCGNANLTSIIANLELKLDLRCLPTPHHVRRLTEVSRFVSEVANLVPHGYQPFVGHSAFAHKGGIHVSAILRNPRTYEHIEPEKVGNVRRVLVSELAGVSNLLHQAERLGLNLKERPAETRRLLAEIKELEHLGYQFESAEASQELMLLRAFGDFEDVLTVQSLRIHVTQQAGVDIVAEAVLKLSVSGEVVHAVAEGDGPVNALDNALRKALRPFYPAIDEMHLADYKVRVLDGKDGTAAKVRVLIESTNGSQVWRTVGVSRNVVEASWEALADSVRYFLLCVNKSGPTANGLLTY
ncbi:citramalate synthase [Alicyclobacillus shizuokensis]|uniref:citramalate synthase n=1 Tax=Alicyclobacillus shizuokensis TaxID=392014 RepID=UPI00082D2532|nr:citramalate synthase [Alicyclobacillus shizuokensis]